MKESVYHGLNGVVRVTGAGRHCRCGGMKKCSYRWREVSGMVYKIMPCSQCSMDLLKKDPDYNDYIEHCETWVNVSLEEQRARHNRDREAQEERIVARNRRLENLLAQQPLEEPAESPGDNLPEEQ